MANWKPGDPWPDMTYPGGAISPQWSGWVRLVVQAMIAAGTPFTMGPDPDDRLNAGNVMSQPGGLPRATPQPSGLWVDLTCDLVDLDVQLGAHASQGVLTKVEAGTLEVTLADPTAKYDPLNPDGPYTLAGQTRLIPGVPVRAWAEVIANYSSTPPTISRFALFNGTADRWETTWTKWAGERQVKMFATDTTKLFVKMDREEQPPQGAGELTQQRMQRIIAFHQANVVLASYFSDGGTMLQATTLAQSAWEQIGRTMDDELGVAYFIPNLPTATWSTVLIWYGRPVWSSGPQTGNTVKIGCPAADDPAPTQWLDIAVDAQPASFDSLLHNAVHASRSGGTMQTAINQASIDRYGQQDLQRTDLGLNDDTQVAAWAQFIVAKASYPQSVLEHLTMEPALDAVRYAKGRFLKPSDPEWQRAMPNNAWLAVLGAQNIMGTRNRVRFDAGYVVDLQFRIVGWRHQITADRWEITWNTAPWTIIATTVSFHLGPHAQDRLDAGWLMGG